MDKYLNPPDPQPEPTPEPEPEPIIPDLCIDEVNLDYDAFAYGDPCDGRHDQSLCESSCDHCHQSWPVHDANKWSSEDAACRCMPAQGSAQDYTYGKLSHKSDAGLCDTDCDECRWSWPTDDPLKWKSDQLMPRCMPAGVEPYEPDAYADWEPEAGITFGGDCENLYDQTCGSNCTSCNWSWPSGDPQTWASDQAMCRCEEKQTFIWGNQCSSLTSGLCGAFCQDCREATLLDDGTSTCRCKAW